MLEECSLYFQGQVWKLCESLNALNWETVSQKLMGLGFDFFKQERLLFENGERGILVTTVSVGAQPLKGDKHGLWLICDVPV